MKTKPENQLYNTSSEARAKEDETFVKECKTLCERIIAIMAESATRELKVRLLTDLKDMASNYVFNPETARTLRINAGLSQRQLAGLIGWHEGEGQSRMSFYETGKKIPTIAEGGFNQKYLAWLKEQGYNPYQL